MGIELVNGEMRAHFLPEKGMNLVSLKRGDVEVIAQDTLPLFEQRYAGLGAMIGPHFHARPAEKIPPIADPSKFPHLAYCQGKDPFSHGIGRYAPWRVVKESKTSLWCELSGEDLWNGVSLKSLEGQDFKMSYRAAALKEGLQIELEVAAEGPSIVGLHTYYALAEGRGRVTAQVEREYNDMGQFKPIPSSWNYHDHALTFDLPQQADFGFVPYPDEGGGEVVLETGERKVTIQYLSQPGEHAWQLWQPPGGTFVCIEPLSAKNPRQCHVSSSRLKVIILID